jgi:hypothetical protein
MIETMPDGNVEITFEDWDYQMMALYSRLHQLPLRPGHPVIRTHELGIDVLSKMPWGKMAIRELFFNADILEYCPDHREVVRLGKAIIRAVIDLDTLLSHRKVDRMHRRDWKPIAQPTPKLRFVRGN